MPGAEIHIKGLEELQRKLDPARFERVVHTGMVGAVDKMLVTVKRYPPKGPGNMPQGPGGHWYERGEGGRYMTVSGDVHKYGNSQKLGASWTKQIEKYSGGWRGIIGNDTTYGLYVMGHKQRSFHKTTGWKKVLTIVRERAPVIERLFNDAISKALS